MPIRTIIIDDESSAVNSLCIILNEYCKDVEIVGTAYSALEGIKEINCKKPNLVFLDVEMPHGSGFDLLDGLQERSFNVVFTTAYNIYAIKAIKYSVLDYLLKPLDIDEVIAVVEKTKSNALVASELNKKYNHLLENIKKGIQPKIILPTNDGMDFFYLNDFIRAEADGSYTRVFLKGKKILTVCRLLKDIEDLFSYDLVFRPHNSHLINMEYIIRFYNTDGGLIEMCDGIKIPLSRRKKNDFFELLKKNNLTLIQ